MNVSPKASLSRIADNHALLLLACGLFTTVMIYNWVFPLGALFYTEGINDCGQMTWNLWHTDQAISSGHNPLFAPEVFYPVGAKLAHHSLGAGFFPLTFLVKHLTGGDPKYPIYTYRLIPLICFTLLFYFSYWFLRELGVSRLGALAASVSYSFAHFYMAHIVHINHMAGFLIPLTAVLLARFYRKPGVNILLLAFVAGVSVYFTEFALYIYMAVGLLVLLMLVMRDTRRSLFTKLHAVGPGKLLTATLLFLLLAGPFIFLLLTDHALKPTDAESSTWSANLAGFVIPDPGFTPLYGRLFASLSHRISVGVGGFETFIGFPMIVFASIALLKVRNRAMLMTAVCGAAFFVLSLGATLKIFGTDTGVPLPYALLMHIPPFDAGRTPVRFIVVALFFIMIVAAFGLNWFQDVIARRRRHLSYAIMILAFLWAAAENYQPVAKQPVFNPPSQLSRIVPGPVFELPVFPYDTYAPLLQVFHRQPITTGYLARLSQAQLDHAKELEDLTYRASGFCDEIKRRGYRNVIITPNEYLPPLDFGGVTQLDLNKCSLPVIDLRKQGTVVPFHANFIIREGREEPIDFPRLMSHTRLYFRDEAADPYLWYGWSARESLSRWTNADRAAIIFSIDQVDRTQPSIKLRIFGSAFIVVGKLDAQRIAVTLNDQEITEWTSTGTEPAERVIEIPANLLQQNNTLIFQLPDATSPRSLHVSADGRLLGFNVQWIELD